MGQTSPPILIESSPEAQRSPDWLTSDEILGLAEFLLERVVQEEDLSGAWQLSLTIADDAGIRDINRQWREKDRATDVLSFPQFEFFNGRLEEDLPPHPADSRILLGDIMISYETCQKQGSEIGHGTRDEFSRLLVHGLLHLIGYDHERGAEDEALMQRREDELLSQIP